MRSLKFDPCARCGKRSYEHAEEPSADDCPGWVPRKKARNVADDVVVNARERQLAIALRDVAVHSGCESLKPDDECIYGRKGSASTEARTCERARKLINVPAGMLAKLEDDDGR